MTLHPAHGQALLDPSVLLSEATPPPRLTHPSRTSTSDANLALRSRFDWLPRRAIASRRRDHLRLPIGSLAGRGGSGWRSTVQEKHRDRPERGLHHTD